MIKREIMNSRGFSSVSAAHYAKDHWRFYNEIKEGDIVIAKKGISVILGFGKVVKRKRKIRFYSEEKGLERTGNKYNPHSNFLNVDWIGKGIEFESFALYPKEDSSPLTILDGKDAAYEVSIYLTDNENDNILGGYVGEWKVSKNDLNSADEATFHIIALEQEHPSEDDMSAFASKLSEHSKLVPAPEVE